MLLVVVAGCGDQPAEAPTAPPTPAVRNVLLITIDTLRADHLGCYGYDRPTTPALDDFARGAVVFDRAFSTSSWTLPAMASLMTSMLPSTHGCSDTRSRLSADVPTLGERLTAAGLTCTGFTGNVFMSSHYGFSQGFGTYENVLKGRRRAPSIRGRGSARAITSDVLTEKAVAWLQQREANATGPGWLLWVHYFDPHADYVRHPGISEGFGRDRAADAYDGEIAFTDLCLGNLLATLDGSGLASTTAVVVAADHGEEFMDHGGTGHRKTLFQEVVRVPLLVRVPGVAAGRCAEPASLVDVLPTILDLLGLPAAPEAAGRSLLPELQGRSAPPRPLFSELSIGKDIDAASVVVGDMKLIHDLRSGAPQLYDLTVDPGEKHDLAAARPDHVTRMTTLLQEGLAAAARLARAPSEAPVQDPGVLEELRALGYVGDEPAGPTTKAAATPGR